jgi:hypothetical protein
MFSDLVLGLLLTLLPAPLRRRWSVHSDRGLLEGAALSGLIECLGTLALLIFRYQQYSAAELARLDTRVMLAAAEKAGETGIQSLGMMILITYALQPLTLVLTYFALEGAVRLGAAFGGGEVVGSLPLVLAYKFTRWARDHARETLQGPRIVDMVFQPETDGDEKYDLGIASCRSKED